MLAPGMFSHLFPSLQQKERKILFYHQLTQQRGLGRATTTASPSNAIFSYRDNDSFTSFLEGLVMNGTSRQESSALGHTFEREALKANSPHHSEHLLAYEDLQRKYQHSGNSGLVHPGQPRSHRRSHSTGQVGGLQTVPEPPLGVCPWCVRACVCEGERELGQRFSEQ